MRSGRDRYEYERVVETREGDKLPARKPKGYAPHDGDRVYLWSIEEGYGGDGLARRGHVFSFHQADKSFRFQITNPEVPTGSLKSCDITDWAARSGPEASVKRKIQEYRPPALVELSEEEAAYLDHFFPS
jgi:hypothetical protein